MTNHTQTQFNPILRSHQKSLLGSVAGRWKASMNKHQQARKINAERRQLLQLSDEMLADIGIDRMNAQLEATHRGIPAQRLRCC